LKTLQVSSQNEWRSWLEKNHAKEDGVWLVFLRKGSGEQSISYQEALDEALAYGWIDSLIKKIDEKRYVRKFTPRRPWSIWSRLNIVRVEKLTKDGKMTSWGLSAYKRRTSGDLTSREVEPRRHHDASGLRGQSTEKREGVEELQAIRGKLQEEVSGLDLWCKDTRNQSEENSGSSHPGFQKCESIAEMNSRRHAWVEPTILACNEAHL
jgi:hypothetical protein